MKAEDLTNIIKSDFYTGVPDSQLKALCDYLMLTYGIDSSHHIIAANEGNALAIAAGYHLATGKMPVVYLQNSGEGNMINPAVSLCSESVYAIPCIFVIGWRGEPQADDEPQHAAQGKMTLQILQEMGISSYIIDKKTSAEQVRDCMVSFRKKLAKGLMTAFVIRKGALTYDGKADYVNSNILIREEIIERILRYSGNDPVLSTTGKTSRELFEIRERNGQQHSCDFLTVGSMGHCSSIALGIALQKPDMKIWCIDGDGAALMHLGSLTVIADRNPENLIHIIINNGAHESVGGQPTVAGNIKLADIACSCGYPKTCTVFTMEELDRALAEAREGGSLMLIEVMSRIGSREDLGRPFVSTLDNKKNFMDHMKKQ